MAPFSARGPGAKPDVVAPGVSLISDRARGSTIDLFNPGARVGWSLFKGTGTSQAAAIVSGVAARMLDANPSLTPDQVKAALMKSTGGRLAGEGGGAGLIDAGLAVDSIARDERAGIAAEPRRPRSGRVHRYRHARWRPRRVRGHG